MEAITLRPERDWVVYAASQTELEQRIYEFTKEEKPGFVFNTVLPNSTFRQTFSSLQPALIGGLVKNANYGDIMALEHLSAP